MTTNTELAEHLTRVETPKSRTTNPYNFPPNHQSEAVTIATQAPEATLEHCIRRVGEVVATHRQQQASRSATFNIFKDLVMTLLKPLDDDVLDLYRGVCIDMGSSLNWGP